MPLGFLAVLALARRLSSPAAIALATLLALVTSATLEIVQNYLPDRVASNLDIAMNVLGAVVGAVAGHLGSPWIVERRGLFVLRDRLFWHGASIDLGLVLVALWLFTQLNPETLLFGNGDLRSLFGAAPPELHPAETFARVEAAVAATNIVALALLLGLLVNAPVAARALFLVVVIVAALAVHALAYAALFTPQEMLAWLTPGAAIGLATGTVAALIAVALRPRWATTLCGVALMAATALVNLAPENPYLTQSLSAWPPGHFLNFNGLTRLVSALWPFAALTYVLAAGGRPR
jgi:hypothetical protein